MAFINPFLSPGQMASDAMDTGSSLASTVGSLAMIAPVAIGGAYGMKAMASNEGGFLNTFASNSMKDMGLSVGNTLRAAERAKQEIREESAQKFFEEVIESGKMKQRIQQNIGNTVEVELMAISELLADPASGIDETSAATIRQRLSGVMLQMESGIEETAKQQLQDVVETLKTSDVQRDLLEKYHRRAARAREHLAAPTLALTRNDPFQQLNDTVWSGMSKKRRHQANQAFEAINSLFGKDSKHTVERVMVREGLIDEAGSAGYSVYARITRGKNKSVMLPVSYARAGGVAPIARGGNALATPYGTNMFFMNAAEAEKVLNRAGGNASVELGKLLQRPEMHMIQAFQQEAVRRGGLQYVDEKWFSEYQRTFFERIDRVGTVHSDSRAVIASNLPTRSSGVFLTGMEQLQDASSFRGKLAVQSLRGIDGVTGFESAGSAEIGDLPGGVGRYGTIGLSTGSTVISNQRFGVSGGITDIERRILTPLTARIEQMFDRGGMSFVRQAENTQNFKAANRVLELGSIGRGGLDKTVFFDVSKGAAKRTGLSEGELYMGGPRFVREAIQPTVIDPRAMTEGGKPMMSRALYNELLRRGEKGIHLRGRSEIDDFFNKYGTVLGTSGANDVRVKPTTGMEELFLRVANTSDAAGQAKVHMAGYTVTKYGESGLDTGKVYGVAGKGMTRNLGDAALVQYFKRAFGDAFRAADYGFGNMTNARSTALVTGDTLFKAPSFLASQMVSGMGLATGIDASKIGDNIDDLYRSVQVGREDVFGKPGTRSTQSAMQSRYLMGLGQNVMTRMQAQGVSSAKAGMVMAGLLGAGGKKKFGLTEDIVGQMMKGFGSFGEEALDIAKKGVAIGRHTFMTGPQSNIYGANLASLEPRMFQQVAYQLRNMFGFSADATNDFMAALMSRKITAAGEIDALREITRTQQTLTGNRLEVLSDKTKVGVKEFMEARRSQKGMAGFLRQHAGGFVLDLSDTSGIDAQAGQRLVRFAKEAFGGSTAISFAGSDILDQIKGTTIRTVSGDDKVIGGHYERILDKFSENLERVAQSVGRGDAEIQAAKSGMASFRSDMSEVFAGTFKRIMGGKLRGSGWAAGRGFDADEALGSLDATPEMKAAVRRVAMGRKGQYGLESYQAFIDSMREFVGGARDEFIAGGMKDKPASMKALSEASQKMTRFFLGMEGGEGPLQGVTQLVGRHPALGILHTSAMEMFRDPREIVGLGAKGDAAMQQLLGTTQGRKAAESYIRIAGLNMKPEELTFQQIRQTSMGPTGQLKDGRKGAAARNFFTRMAYHMDDFFGNVGGGHISFGKQSVDIHYANTKDKRTIDMSIAAAMGGDHDGDMYYLMNPAGENQRRLSKALKNPNSIASLNQYRFTRGLYFEEAGRGIDAFAATLPETGDITSMVMEGVKKEELAKNVGPVDLSLDRIRFGVMQAEGTSRDKEKLLAMVDVLEETMTIKGKKLKRGFDLSSIMTKAVGMAAEGDYTAFQNVLRTIGFRDSPALAAGATIGNVEGLTGAAAEAIQGLDVAIDTPEMRRTLMSALEHSKNLGVDRAKTVRQLMGIAQGTTHQRRAAFETMMTGLGSVQAAMALGNNFETAVASTAQEMSQRVSSAAGKFDKRLLGPLALGVAGALGFGMMVGGEGHSGSPMMMPGEVIAPQVQKQIAGGNIFQTRNTGPDVESLQQPGNQYADINNRPIHQRSTYVSNPNAYSMRGEITSLSGIGMMQNYLNMARSTGSITINDARRPITANYIDRMMDV